MLFSTLALAGLVIATPIQRQYGRVQPLIHRPSHSSLEAHGYEPPKVPPNNREVLLQIYGGDYHVPRSWDLEDNWSGAAIKMSGFDRCLEAGSGPAVGSRLKVYACHGKPWQLWNYADGWLEMTHYGLCVGITGGYILELQTCDYSQPENGTQRFFAY
ncbi:hypothetical protein CC85DRAFT_285713 [Cutaneotrichosporon oleaginosum]|uniref:Uncharacterized protein n=1 Tax=Cutaneotrichosporon oleaginosum TaxID=879819 RepID=A0A0J0XMH7_9TREE|nr:uncharacterized protein CC85DRAFT_285713 [Cutaneotrichosporon oleaginosum]KLT42311.1 hypothetical protein CC85DRAFT_285713 [Cutaneotrichosporon oleaginosum]TXT11483.1 hypothetical protein COLE_01893 [Cutaneotrichosporon oleaginosum]